MLKSIKIRTATLPNIFHRNSIQSESNINVTATLQSPSLPDNNSINEPNLLKLNNSTDIQDTYILIYTQAYDHNRVTLVLNIIDSLLDFIPEQLIQSLLVTSNIQASPICIHNKELNELFLKHCYSIEGKKFDFINENSQECKSYLYLLLNILLVYTYSYYPRMFDSEKNLAVKIRSLMLLTRICHDLSCICMDNKVFATCVVNLLKKISFQKIILSLFNRIINKESYFKHLIRLLEEIILLENIIKSTDSNLIDQSIADQTIFISTILQYLKSMDFINYHQQIISFIIRILPHCDSGLKTISIRIIEQICLNITFMVQNHTQSNTIRQLK